MFNRLGKQNKIFKSNAFKTNNKNLKYIVIIGLLLIILILTIVVTTTNLHSSNKIIRINSEYTKNLNSTPFLFSLNNTDNTEYTAYLYSAINNTAFIYIQKLPNFINPVMQIELRTNNSTKINLGSQYADLEIKLNAISKTYNAINISFYPLQQYLLIKPDLNSISIVTQYTSQASSPITPISSPIPKSNITSLTHTINSTAIPSSSSTNKTANSSIALNLLKTNNYYALMQNYSHLYLNAANNCTPSLYNSTYIAQYSHNPASGSYQAQKQNSPINISMSSSSKNAVFYFTFKSIFTNSSLNGIVLTLSVDTSSATISNSTFSGIFEGNTYNQMAANYQALLKINNACAVYVL